MPRTARLAPGGIIHRVLSRGVGKTKLFGSQKDYAAFQRCLIEAQQIVPMRVLGYCIMPNHWHLLLWPQEDGELARRMMWLTNTHMRRWLTAHQQVGSGHLYQGRYKSFAMQDDEHFWTVDRYIARNAVRAKMVELALPRPARQRRDHGLQVMRVDRLGDVHLEPRQKRPSAILFMSKGRECDRRKHLGVQAPAADLANQFVAVVTGHGDIAHQHLGIRL